MQKRRQLLAAIGALLSGPALAHDDSNHKSNSTLVKEQKPWGIAGDAKAVRRSIELQMHDHMRFTPDQVQVRQGETVRFVLQNKGRLSHEFVIGSRKDLDEHAALMAKFPNMEHDEPYMAHVAPGKTGEVIWNFNRAGEFDFGCLIAGHYSSGMVGRIKVVTR